MKCKTCCTVFLNTRPIKTTDNSFLISWCVYFRSGLCCTTHPFQPCCGSGWQPGTFINRWPRRLLRTRTVIHLRPLSSSFWSKQICSNVFLFFMLLILCENAPALPVLPTAPVVEYRYLQKLTAQKSFSGLGLKGEARSQYKYQILLFCRSSGLQLPTHDPCLSVEFCSCRHPFS